VAPTSSPSTNYTESIKRSCTQILEVETAEKFETTQVLIFEDLMQSYTAQFGYQVGMPSIVTECVVTSQELAGRRRRTRRTRRRTWKRTGHTMENDTNNSTITAGIQEMATEEKSQRRQLQSSPLLIMSFTMQYDSRYNYDLDDYPRKFQTFINTDLQRVAQDMKKRFLPVVAAQDVIVLSTDEPTRNPTASPTPGGRTRNPSRGPSSSPSPPGPTDVPSGEPSARIPSAAPSYVATTSVPSIEEEEEEEIVDVKDRRVSFGVGLAAGLGGAAIVIAVLIWYMRRKSREKDDRRNEEGDHHHRPRGHQRHSGISQAGGRRGYDDGRDGNGNGEEEGILIRQIDAIPSTSSGHRSGGHNNNNNNAIFVASYDRENTAGVGGRPSSPQGGGGGGGGAGTIADSIFSNPSLVSGGESFDTDPTAGGNNNDDSLVLDPLQDEFDSYKNQDLEFMRNGVEESVYGAEGMMSLAMTRALMEDEDRSEISPSWGGAEDPESIEANGLCETNDWLRKHDHSTIDERNLFFQEILNKMVTTVRRGMISPSDSTRAMHCCAAMLGLQLERDLPNNVLLVHGMRKTNDLSLGRSYLVEAFKPFGDIEGAAIAPNNRGFGFVRFVSPRSVQRALERFRISEIEVQDVSVMIKSLKSDAQVM